MPTKSKATPAEVAIKEHERLRTEALTALDTAHDAIVAAGAAYDRAVAAAKAEGMQPPETLDVVGARARHSKSVSNDDIRAGADPRLPFFALRKVWCTRF